eukprot:CAMPEP_0174829836 /NCGR_PEP_ID=MMETSP1114-20130205/2177_1 /TAXON_ID=312471 /ORGANISM="Neobodo designis, Strain CCAP 1951/1" /LENGTH=251 /DNA_ID=CAMNT_0016063605 /DNA_START=65 /DNA_END=820 /DNA_ORIENTATION=+
MVSFNCNRCGDVVKKPKVQSHAAQCGTAGYSCVDCMQPFDLTTIENHRQCVSETEKYQGKWQQKKHVVKAAAEGAAPRPKFSANDFDDTDMDDDAPVAKSKPAASSAELKGRVPDDSSDDDDDHMPAKAKTAKKKSVSRKASPAMKPAAGKKKVTPVATPKHVPTLPAAAGSVIVPDFELGDVSEVADMCAGVLEQHGAASMPLKTVVAQLAAEVYAKRIQKKVTAAIMASLSGKAPLKGVAFDDKNVRTA